MKIILIFLNGDFHAPTFNVQQADFVIAADGGIRHAQALGCKVDLWLGDFDSSSFYNNKYIHMQIGQKKRFPTEKDQTDWELALEEVKARFSGEDLMLAVIGATGNEPDHVFANMWSLGRYPFRALISAKQHNIIYAPAPFSFAFKAKAGDIFSVIALEELMLTANGLKWEMDNKVIKPYEATACRNEATENQVKINASRGKALLFMPRSISIMSSD